MAVVGAGINVVEGIGYWVSIYAMTPMGRLLALVLAVACCSVRAAPTQQQDQLKWWQKSIFYQIYPRSYQDTDNNGIGDLNGILQRVEYLKDLGVTGIWMNPIYDSPLKDFGYDISDYTSIDKTFGTFTDFSNLVNKIHEMNMTILMDLVPNHSSDQHKWFKEALKGNKTYQDYYVWEKASGIVNNYPPNNWASVMGGSAWQWNDDLKMYYYHAFLKEQPDLNYRNPQVVEEMKKVLTFWLDLGVDGFRVDAVPFLVESKDLRDEPLQPGCNDPNNVGCLDHIYTQNQPETFEVLSQFKKTLDDYRNDKFPGEKIMVLESYVDIKTIQNYFSYNGKSTSTMPFNFQLIYVNMETNGTILKGMVDTWTSNLIPEGWSNWVTGNHDQNRVGHKVGTAITDGMNMLVLLLPGTSFSYYGEELGMDDTYIDCFQMQDTQAIRQANGDCGKMESLSRDPERTPMQWDSSTYGNFSKAKPWLPLNPNYIVENVEAQKMNSSSHLNIYKLLTQLKAEMMGCKNLTTKAPANGWVFGFKRFECTNSSDSYVVLLNFNDEESTVNVVNEFDEKQNMYVRAVSRFSDKKMGDKIAVNNLVLRPKESIVLSTIFKGSPSTSGQNVLSPSLTLLALSMLYIIFKF